MPRRKKDPPAEMLPESGMAVKSNGRPTSLKDVAASVNLSITTVSFVLNNSSLAATIPQETKDRVFEAARKLKYRPNFIARSLRAQKTFSVGVLVPELSEGYSATVLSGIEERLLAADYFYFVASHRHREDLIKRYSQLFAERCVDGLLAVDTPQNEQALLPVVSISGHDQTPGVTNIVLNHDRAAQLALGHLRALGHRKIAIIKGQEFSSDTEARWQSIATTAQGWGAPIDEQLVVQLEGEPGMLPDEK